MSPSKLKTVLVTGANGYIGSAIARAFVHAGYRTYGLIRSSSSIPTLLAAEIIPILGSFTDHSFITSLADEKVSFDVLVSATEDIFNYVPHYEAIISTFRALATLNGNQKPLVLFTSGCKDYGMSPYLASSPDLAPHTEESPLNAPPFLADRCKYAIKVFEHTDVFDAAVMRPTNVFGYDSSFYGSFFLEAEKGKKEGVWEVREERGAVLHGMHVDDCGEAYVALAERYLVKPEGVKGECFNVSASEYETLKSIVGAVAREYGVDVKWGVDDSEGPATNWKRMVMGFSQWVGSEKIRKLTGWTDKRRLFSEEIGVYRRSFELATGNGESTLHERYGLTSESSKK